MTERIAPESYGEMSEPATLTIQRLLPGPIERVWAYLTENDLRRQWLAAGEMDLKTGAPFELTWRNDELSLTPSQRPEGFPAEQRMRCHITELDPPHKLTFTWQGSGDVSFELRAQGNDGVLLTMTHRRLPDRHTTLMVSAGWHMHLHLLVASITGREKAPFWEGWARLKQAYEERLPS
ncbi:ATPase [Hydrogenophaga crassostreae]|uniref:ATPase n=1 Tax=Hydrogenophaga crassostreae TaxID=1763535 RepID=A0A162SSD7_9BURK|nr:SRPBCC family protein [Hydrogenophaga crassostreae]AOW12745.1 ATPase [Hydrogenophaga crassostreae]OAD39934.1 ATPase [Hydrogenophaga crassostreae]